MEGADFTAEVTTQKPYHMGEGKDRVAVIDFGIKANILAQLVNNNFALDIYPASVTAERDISKPVQTEYSSPMVQAIRLPARMR